MRVEPTINEVPVENSYVNENPHVHNEGIKEDIEVGDVEEI